ncbi:MAG: tripartite tricarboxylate transporter substrate binding protein, partial [Haliea sp.]
MKPHHTFSAAVLLGLALAAGSHAHAAAFPDKPIKLVTPFPPGGLVGTIAHAVATRMSVSLGQPVVLEPRPGAAGSIAAGMVARAPKDGYTLLFGTSSMLGIARYMYKDLPYDPVNDFAPVAILGNVTVGVFASQKSGIDSLEDLYAKVRAAPGKVNYGSIGVGSVSHLAAELFKSRAKVDIVHVPYAGTVPQMMDLIGGETQLGFNGIASGINYAKDGRMKLIAVAAKTRSKAYPSVPALGESLPGYEAPAWLGIVAPRGTPQPVLDRLEAAAQETLADKDIRAMLDGQGVDPEPMS